LKLGADGDSAGTAAATALLLGMRASEIAERIVRDLDGGGRVLAVTASKTAAGVRRLRVPAVLQPLLHQLAAGKRAADRLFGAGVNRHWVLRAVARVCRAAGVPAVTPHGLRGTHATLAVGAGISGDAVAASLGHESFAVTAAHYARPEAVSGAQAARVADTLS
jgi:integrase